MIKMIINRDCETGLKELSPKTVDMCITSPPYWGLRDYGVDGQLGLEPSPEEYIPLIRKRIESVETPLIRN